MKVADAPTYVIGPVGAIILYDVKWLKAIIQVIGVKKRIFNHDILDGMTKHTRI